MFDNIGGKIKTLAEVVCGLGITLFVLAAILIGMQGDIFTGLLVLVLGSLGTWIGGFFTYGFGELIENTTRIHEDNLEL